MAFRFTNLPNAYLLLQNQATFYYQHFFNYWNDNGVPFLPYGRHTIHRPSDRHPFNLHVLARKELVHHLLALARDSRYPYTSLRHDPLRNGNLFREQGNNDFSRFAIFCPYGPLFVCALICHGKFLG